MAELKKITASFIKGATGANNENAEKYLPALNEYLFKYNINTDKRALAFLAQVGHESAGLLHVSELASGDDYEGRQDLGNKYKGDGRKFKGRGLIQLTGRTNYRAFGKYVGMDLESNPEVVATNPKLAVLAAVWYWNSRNLNQYADQMDTTVPVDHSKNKLMFEKITRVINGGTNGLADRKKRWNSGQNKLKEFFNELVTEVKKKSP